MPAEPLRHHADSADCVNTFEQLYVVNPTLTSRPDEPAFLPPIDTGLRLTVCQLLRDGISYQRYLHAGDTAEDALDQVALYRHLARTLQIKIKLD